jgi:hypothetical protein
MGWIAQAPQRLIIVIYTVGLGILGSSLIRHFGFPLDDSWIHQSVGRNFAHFGSLGYLPDQRSSGSTSLLWTFIVSVNYRLVPGLSPVLFTLSLNILFTLAIALILFHLALRDRLGVALAVLIAAAPAFDGNYLWLAFTGMEHTLFMLLSVATIWFWTTPNSTERAGWASTIGAGICMGLLGMTRPEGIALPVVLLGITIAVPRARTRSIAQIAAASVIFAAFAWLPFAVNLNASHTLLPVTFQGRQWLLVTNGGSHLQVAGQLLGQWGVRVVQSIIPFASGGLGLRDRILLMLGLLPVLGLVFIGSRALVVGRAWSLLAVCGWGLLHSLLYLVILPSTGHGGRYQPFLLLLLLPVLCVGAADLLQRQPRAAFVVPATGLLAFGVVSLFVWRAVLASGIDHIAHTHGVVGEWLADHIPTQSVAVFDIGRIGYSRGAFGDPRIIDLGGLTDPTYPSYLYAGKVPFYLASHGIHYVVLPTDSAGHSGIGRLLRLTDNPGVERTRRFRVCSTRDDWRLGWIETGNAVQCQEVDSVRF